MLTARRPSYHPATQRPARPEPLRRGWHVASLEKLRKEFLTAKAHTTRRGEPASQHTLDAYRGALRSFENHVVHETGNDLASSFTARLVESWLVQLRKRGRSQKSLAAVCQPAIREFAKWGLRRGYWRVDPTADLPVMRVPRALPRPFSPAERNALLALPLSPKEAALRGVLYHLGLRDGTIVRITLGDIQGPELAPTGKVLTPGVMWTLGKGNKEGVKPINATLWALLVAYDETRAPDDKRSDSFLFANPDGSAWKTKTIQRLVRRWGAAAGVEKCTPHRFRHTSATDMLTRTGNIRAVQKFLGHASLATTQIYAEVVDSILIAAVDTLAEIDPVTPGLDSGQPGAPETQAADDAARKLAP